MTESKKERSELRFTVYSRTLKRNQSKTMGWKLLSSTFPLWCVALPPWCQWLQKPPLITGSGFIWSSRKAWKLIIILILANEFEHNYGVEWFQRYFMWILIAVFRYWVSGFLTGRQGVEPRQRHGAMGLCPRHIALWLGTMGTPRWPGEAAGLGTCLGCLPEPGCPCVPGQVWRCQSSALSRGIQAARGPGGARAGVSMGARPSWVSVPGLSSAQPQWLCVWNPISRWSWIGGCSLEWSLVQRK